MNLYDKNGHDELKRTLARLGSDHQSRFVAACLAGDVDVMRTELAAGAKLDAFSTMHGKTAVEAVATLDNAAILKVLLHLGAKATTEALCDAIHFNRIENAYALIHAGANLDGFSNTGSTPLMEAVRSQAHEIGRALLRRGASPDMTDRRGLHCPLSLCVLNVDMEFAKDLIDAGALSSTLVFGDSDRRLMSAVTGDARISVSQFAAKEDMQFAAWMEFQITMASMKRGPQIPGSRNTMRL